MTKVQCPKFRRNDPQLNFQSCSIDLLALNIVFIFEVLKVEAACCLNKNIYNLNLCNISIKFFLSLCNDRKMC